MKYQIALTAASALIFGSPALAQVNEPAANYKVEQQVEVVERNARGHATVVRIDGELLDVCMNDRQDDCIQPRAAGLGFGEKPLPYWPNGAVDSRD